MAIDENGDYQPGPLVTWFHSFPHVDITLSPVNSTFDPTSTVYLEALGILAAVPGFWLILNLMAFLIYFLSRCCQRKWKQKKHLAPCKWTLAVLAILCCGAVAVGLYGNEEAHGAVNNFTKSVEDIQSTVHTVKNKTLALEKIVESNLKPDLDLLKQDFQENPKNASLQELLLLAVANMSNDVELGTNDIKDINRKLGEVDVGVAPKDIERAEDFRWPITLALMSLLMLLCFLVLLGVIRSSRPILIWFSTLALLAIIINWVLVSVYLATGVGLADLCADPDPYVRSQLEKRLEQDVLEYYLECDDDKKSSPFQNAIQDGEKAVERVKSKLDFVLHNVYVVFPDAKELQPILQRIQSNVNFTGEALSSMVSLLDCRRVHRDYERAVEATCGPFLSGIAFLLMSAVLAGVLFILLEWVASNTWIYIKKKRPYVAVDEQDPFLPHPGVSSNPRSRGRDSYGSTAAGYRPRHSHTPPQTPPFPGSHNGRVHRIDEELPGHGRYTPPPSYEQLHCGLATPSAPLES